MSSAVKGLPSDHFMPFLSLKVYSLPPPATSMLLATLGWARSTRVPPHQRLVRDGAPQPDDIGRAENGRVPGAAVLADLIDRLHDHGLIGQTLLDSRQIAGFYLLGQLRRFFALFGGSTGSNALSTLAILPAGLSLRRKEVAPNGGCDAEDHDHTQNILDLSHPNPFPPGKVWRSTPGELCCPPACSRRL